MILVSTHATRLDNVATFFKAIYLVVEKLFACTLQSAAGSCIAGRLPRPKHRCSTRQTSHTGKPMNAVIGMAMMARRMRPSTMELVLAGQESRAKK